MTALRCYWQQRDELQLMKDFEIYITVCFENNISTTQIYPSMMMNIDLILMCVKMLKQFSLDISH